jgi:uncharacterized membrane protein
MPKSVAEEIASLKRDNKLLKKRVSALEATVSPFVHTDIEVEQDIPQAQGGSKAGAIVLLVFGILLSITMIGAIIGIPMIIIGIVLLNKKQSVDTTQEIEPESNAEVQKLSKPSKDINVAKVFSIIGILALVIGVGFFIKFAIDNEWINHITRIVLGVLFGIILVVGGLIVAKREDLKAWAETLAGGGFAIIYFSIYAAYHFPAYQAAIGIPLVIDILLLTLIVVIAAAVSLLKDSKIIISLAFLLGYVTSLLSLQYSMLTLIYALLLSIALISVSIYKKWFAMGLISVIATYGLFAIWYGNNMTSFAIASVFLIIYYVVFTVQAMLLGETEKKVPIIAALNNLVFFGLYSLVLAQNHVTALEVLPIALAIINIVIAVLRPQSLIKQVHAYLAIFFATMSILLAINPAYMTSVFVLEAAILFVIAVKSESQVFKVSAHIVFGIAVLKTLLYDTFFLTSFSTQNVVGSTRLISYAVTIIAFFAIAIFVKSQSQLSKGERAFVPAIYSGIATALTILITFMEFDSPYTSIVLAILTLALCFASRGTETRLLFQSAFVAIILGIVTLTHSIWSNTSTTVVVYLIAIVTYFLIYGYLEFQDIDGKEIFSWAAIVMAAILVAIETQDFWMSMGWSIIAIIALIVGFSFKKSYFRQPGILLFVLVILKTFLYDTRNLETVFRTLSFIILGILLLGVSFVYAKFKDRIKEII